MKSDFIIEMYSSYGKWIVKRISEIPVDFELAAIIRHSERPDFKDIPPEKWNSTLLTSYGEESALDFGKALVNEAGASSVAAKGWGLKRCQLTAERIAEGAIQAGSNESRFSSILEFPSPISDLELYRKYLKEGKYFDLVRDWFSANSSMNAMRPYGPYSRDIISRIVKDHMSSEKRVTVIVTHDLHVLPMLNQVFGTNLTEVDFMDGILIARNSDRLLFFTKDSEKSLTVTDFD